MDTANREVDFKFKDPLSVELVSSEYEIFLRAPIGRAWEKIIDGMDNWWPHRFKPGSIVVIEPRVMGRWEERFDDKGNGALYGMVTYCDPPNAFAAVGQWGMFGAINSGGLWKLTEQDGGTLLRTRGEMMGHITQQMLDGRTEGSVGLLKSLRHWVEDDLDWRKLEEMNK
ncbi:MAG: hypothetical protein H7A35_06290 [Planctomycetales bacterium]|nr:hypothetical protein [bacterium]UNM09668.1 MAG: hypothetical protein H7A35_06290 [Planctomycetales bacterium]